MVGPNSSEKLAQEERAVQDLISEAQAQPGIAEALQAAAYLADDSEWDIDITTGTGSTSFETVAPQGI